MNINQRRHERIRVNYPAAIRAVARGADGCAAAGAWIRCMTGNVSMEGVRLAVVTQVPLAVGADVWLRVKPAWWRRTCAFRGTVRWARNEANRAAAVLGLRIEAGDGVRRRWYRVLRRLARKQARSEPAPA